LSKGQGNRKSIRGTNVNCGLFRGKALISRAHFKPHLGERFFCALTPGENIKKGKSKDGFSSAQETQGSPFQDSTHQRKVSCHLQHNGVEAALLAKLFPRPRYRSTGASASLASSQLEFSPRLSAATPCQIQVLSLVCTRRHPQLLYTPWSPCTSAVPTTLFPICNPLEAARLSKCGAENGSPFIREPGNGPCGEPILYNTFLFRQLSTRHGTDRS
jgi:hypothetical protein